MPFDHLRYLSKLKNYLFTFLAVLGLRCRVGFSLVAVRRSTLKWLYTGFSSQWLLLLQSTGCRARGLQ